MTNLKCPPYTTQSTSQIILIDMQTRLLAAMPNAQRIVRNSHLLLKVAQLLNIPATLTEQYPRGLGHTDETLLSDGFHEVNVIEKMSFSCVQSLSFMNQIKRSQLILSGVEAHICVLQTALDLIENDYQVFVLADAIDSRQSMHYENALQRMQSAGCIISNVESVVFEWLGCADHPLFKQISMLFRDNT